MGWFAVHAKAQAETRAAQWCSILGFEAYLPQILERKAVRPLFPRYLFVREATCWWRLKSAPGVQSLLMADDKPASLPDKVVEELRRREINGLIRLPKRDYFTRGQKLRVRDPWHILSGYDLEFSGMTSHDRVRVMLEWFGRRQVIALPINSIVAA